LVYAVLKESECCWKRKVFKFDPPVGERRHSENTKSSIVAQGLEAKSQPVLPEEMDISESVSSGIVNDEEIWEDQCCRKLGWKSELYAVKFQYVVEIIDRLGLKTPNIDAFSLEESKRFKCWWGPGSQFVEDSFTVKWTHSIVGLLWANPPFSLIANVIHKLKKDHGHAVLVVPKWVTAPWWEDLQDIVVRMLEYPCATPLFELVGAGFTVPPTKWPVQVAFVCGRISQCFKLAKVPNPISSSAKRRMRRQKMKGGSSPQVHLRLQVGTGDSPNFSDSSGEASLQ
jgi:hypothetical protein